MRPWIESLGAAAICISGILLGKWISRLRKPYWTAGYFVPLTILLIFALAHYLPPILFALPISWMFSGRTEYVVFGFVVAMVLSTPQSRLPQRRMRIAVWALIIVATWQLSVWPFLAPAFNQKFLANLKTRMDGNGVCLQNTDYTCGPAAAVTGLRKLGLSAEEGEIAIHVHATSSTGTDADVLAKELQKRYGKNGLTAEFRGFTNVIELKGLGPTLAVTKFSFLIDHFVTVLEVNDTNVIIGDPLNGSTTLSHQEFQEKWRFLGVVLQRKPN